MTAKTLEWAQGAFVFFESLPFFSEVFSMGNEKLWDKETLLARLEQCWPDRLESKLNIKKLTPIDPGFATSFLGKYPEESTYLLRDILAGRLGLAVAPDGFVGAGETFDEYVLAIDFALYFSPKGSAMYNRIAPTWKLIRDRMGNESYLFVLENAWGLDDERIQTMMKLVKGKPENLHSALPGEVQGSKGIYCYKYREDCAAFFANWRSIQEGDAMIDLALVNNIPENMLNAEFVFSKKVDDIISCVEESVVPKGEYEANPVFSTPNIVALIEKKLKLSKDAAALYLQLCALPYPRDANIREWNKWKKKTHDLAVDELLAQQYIVRAKRSKAGRTVFIHGHWGTAQSKMHLESWKLSHLGWGVEEMDQRAFSNALLTPPTLLFGRVWERFENNDFPKFNKVNRLKKHNVFQFFNKF